MKKRGVFFIAGIVLLVITGIVISVRYFGGRNKTQNPAQPDPAGMERLAELQTELREAPGDLLLAEAILELQVMNLDRIEDALSLAGEYGDSLKDSMMAQVYLAVAESRMGGIAESVIEKVRWVNRGMRHFDDIHRQWPDNEMVYTYQVITCSYFPAILGMYQDVLDQLAVMREKYRTGEWVLDEGQADRIWLTLRNLREQYPNGAKNREIRDFARNMKESLPLMAGRPGAAELLDD